jgi:UDP-N-acetylglucosamine 4,6-dehydratase
MNWSEKTILLTGGTGSFGQKFTELVLKKYNPKVIRIFSRGELEQIKMKMKFNNDSRLRFFIGDVRDKSRVSRAMDGVDIVVHAAALKQVPVCEYNPFEAVATNILGSQIIIDSAIDHNIERVIAISTDKAVNPVNLYGSTKMCMEKIIVAANSYIGGERQTRLSCVRYGNVVGSRGSIIPLLQKQNLSGVVTITDERMTRFWITLEQGIKFVIRCIDMMIGGEIFIPKLPSMKIMDLAKVISPSCKIKFIGIRPGEKINECLITTEESSHTIEYDDFYIIKPEHPWWSIDNWKDGKPLPEGFKYVSNDNVKWLSEKELSGMVKKN